jgi:hypothetical protein
MTACWRYRITTGHDGLSLSRRVARWPTTPQPTSLPATRLSQTRRRYSDIQANGLWLWLQSDPRMSGLQRRLETLLTACGGEWCPSLPKPPRAPWRSWQRRSGHPAQCDDLESEQTAIKWWTDGPAIVVTVGNRPPSP